MHEGLKYDPKNLEDYKHILDVAEVKREEKLRPGDYLKYIGGAVHIHSNESEGGIYASQSLAELADFLKQEIDKRSGKVEFMLLTEHSEHLGLEKSDQWLLDHGFDPGEISEIKAAGSNFGAQIINLSPEQRELSQSLGASVLEEQRKEAEEISKEKDLKVFLGIETSIMTPDGELTLPDETLQELDAVIVSIHDDQISTQKRKIPAYKRSVQGLVKLYEKVLENPNTDVIGHPIKSDMKEIIDELKTELDDTGKLDSLNSLFGKMAEKNVAFEINMKDPLAGLAEREGSRSLFGEVVRLAKVYGTPLSIGIDWHLFKHWQYTKGILDKIKDKDERAAILNKEENVESIKESEEIRKEHGMGIKFWLRLVRICKMFNSNGIKKDQVVNSSKANFEGWLAQRGVSS